MIIWVDGVYVGNFPILYLNSDFLNLKMLSKSDIFQKMFVLLQKGLKIGIQSLITGPTNHDLSFLRIVSKYKSLLVKPRKVLPATIDVA